MKKNASTGKAQQANAKVKQCLPFFGKQCSIGGNTLSVFCVTSLLMISFFLVPPSVSEGKLVFFLLLLFNHNYSKNGSPSIIHVCTTMLLRALSTNSVSSFITFLHNIVLWAISIPKSVLFPLSTAHFQTSFENTACQHAAALRPRRTATFV